MKVSRLDSPLRFSNGVAWHPTGLRVEVMRAGGGMSDRVLAIDGLNPQSRICHVMSRLDCFKLGALVMWRAIFAHDPRLTL